MAQMYWDTYLRYPLLSMLQLYALSRLLISAHPARQLVRACVSERAVNRSHVPRRSSPPSHPHPHPHPITPPLHPHAQQTCRRIVCTWIHELLVSTGITISYVCMHDPGSPRSRRVVREGGGWWFPVSAGVLGGLLGWVGWMGGGTGTGAGT